MAKRRVQPQKRARLGDQQKEVLLATIIRSEPAFRIAVDHGLEPRHFEAPDSRAMALVWETTCEFYDQFGELPTDELLCAEIGQRVTEASDELSNGDIDELNELIRVAFEIPVADLDIKVARSYTSRLLEEHLQQELREAVAGDVSADFPQLLMEKMVRAQAIKAIGSGELAAPFPSNSLDDFQKLPGLKKYTTGVKPLDMYMQGQANKEVYGLCAPYGVGKTLVAVQLAAFRAKWEHSRWAEAQRRTGKRFKLPMVYLAAWEEEVESLQVRVLSYLAQVPRTLIEDQQWSELSTGANPSTLKPYEQKRFARRIAAGSYVPGERERLQRAIQLANMNLRFIDFTGADQSLVEAGANGAAGLASVIRADQLSRNNPGVSMVVADHANAMAEAAIEYHGWDHDRKKRHLVGTFPKALKANIAAVFNCPVWAMHQLDTKANSRAPGVEPGPTDMAEAKNFFEYANYGFQLGTKTFDELCVLANGKARRGAKQRSMVVHIDGVFCTCRDTGNKYRIHANKIVAAEDYAKYADDSDDSFQENDREARAIMRNHSRDIGI